MTPLKRLVVQPLYPEWTCHYFRPCVKTNKQTKIITVKLCALIYVSAKEGSRHWTLEYRGGRRGTEKNQLGNIDKFLLEKCLNLKLSQ